MRFLHTYYWFHERDKTSKEDMCEWYFHDIFIEEAKYPLLTCEENQQIQEYSQQNISSSYLSQNPNNNIKCKVKFPNLKLIKMGYLDGEVFSRDRIENIKETCM
jgi:hypothetical protein